MVVNNLAIAQAPADLAPPAAPRASATDGLEAAATDFELLGVRFRRPEGSVMRSEGTGRTATWIISERSEAPRFILRLSKLYASEPQSSPAAQIDEYVKTVSERPSPNTVFAVRSRKEFGLAGRPAGELYTSLREGEGADEVSAVQGYFLLQLAPNEFVVISSLLAEADFASTRPLLDRSFRTLEPLDPAAADAARAERMAKGIHLIEGLDEDALRRALDPVPEAGKPPAPRWYRLTRTDPDGTVQEAGYMTMSVLEAPQGRSNPDREEKEWNALEREPGLMVRIQMRTLLDPSAKAVTDTDARYWMRWDRQREFWTVRTTARSGKNTRTSAQLGIREAPSAARPRPSLEVTDMSQTQAAVPPRRWNLPPEGYVSQAEAMVLPRLLPAAKERTAYGFYWFETRSARIAQRVDVATPRGDGMEVDSRRSLESGEARDAVDRRGVLRSRSTDDGMSMEATTGPELLALWKRKGLPVE
jgi:hypothetical protein